MQFAPLLFLFMMGVQPDTGPTYVISVEANGLMCPFLGPMAVERLRAWSPVYCVRDPEASTIRITLRAEDLHTAQDLQAVLEGVGYEQEKIHVHLVDE